MDISWDDARLFLAVAEGGSVSAAGRHLKVAQPTVSRRLRELEGRLGFALFARSTHGVGLTPRGEAMLGPARQMATWAAELSRAAEAQEGPPTGVVRVTAPPGVAADFLAPFAAWLRGPAPGITLEVIASVAYVDLGRGKADLAIRFPSSAQSGDETKRRDLTVVARRRMGIAAWASPGYAARVLAMVREREAVGGSGVLGPTDVAWIGWAAPYEHLSPTSALAALIPGFAPVFTADDYLVQMAAAEAGVGVIVFGDHRHRFSTGRLVRLPLDLSAYGTRTLTVLGPPSALQIPRVRLVADLLREELRASTL